MELRSGKNEAILLLRADLVDEEVFPRLTCTVSGVAGDALLIEQLPQQPSDRAAHRIDRAGIVTKPLITRATLIPPPPPGSRRCDRPRNLATGTILSTAVERSTAGLGVIVTMSVMDRSNHGGPRQRARTY